MNQQGSRLHSLDALRLFLMLLGIPFHAGMIYTQNANWLIRSSHDSVLLSMLTAVLHSFRMSGFFLLSGFFASLTIRRRESGPWLKAKLVQLIVPLVFCWLLLTPPQIFVASLSKLGHPVMQWREAFQMTTATLARPGKLWVLHLWFLIDLILICSTFGLLWRFRNSLLLATVLDKVARLAATRPSITQAGIILVFLGMTMSIQAFHAMLHVPEVTFLNGLIQVQSSIYYGSFFALGATLQARPALLAWFRSPGPLNLVMTIMLVAICAGLALHDSRLSRSLTMFVQTVTALSVMRTLFWIATRFFEMPSRFVRGAADSAYTVYLLHHPVVAVLGFLCIRAAMPPLLAWTVIVIMTALFTITFHRHVVVPSRVLSFLLNGRLSPATRQPLATV